MAACSPLSVFASDCMDTASTQGEMNKCAHQLYKAADKQLNDTYHSVTTRLGDDAQIKKKLVAAQRNWVAFRDAECDFVAFQTAGGTVEPMVKLLCLEKVTTKRAAELQDYLDCQEGDTSCPLPPAK
ncbi:hypothetical protein A3SK_0109495 [Pseudomonas amygdali pv. tabaci str. 6605]|nr:hypothetical protein A3SK_0109495 [Pseudomonas amygdali pv. tabaci str. 6605]